MAKVNILKSKYISTLESGNMSSSCKYNIIIETYIKGCNIYLILRLVRYISYINLKMLSVLINWLKNLSINFIIKWPVFLNWKDKFYNSIIIIIHWHIKIVYYKSIKITIDTSSHTKIILDVII